MIERFRVIPFEDREVEQIHAESEPIAAERIALEVEIIIVRLRERNRLACTPGKSKITGSLLNEMAFRSLGPECRPAE